MTEISYDETILSRQLKLLQGAGVTDVVITTGLFDRVLVDYCESLNTSLNITFVNNPVYDKTNYIYSIYCAKNELDGQDIILMHGDLVFEASVLNDILAFDGSCMATSSTLLLPEKDFKAVVIDGKVRKVGVEFFDDAREAQALYKLKAADWTIWLNEIERFCEADDVNCYAEKALNKVSGDMDITAFDLRDRLCSEIDTPEDLAVVTAKLREVENRTVYMCFSTDMIHTGHISIIKKRWSRQGDRAEDSFIQGESGEAPSGLCSPWRRLGDRRAEAYQG